jgi:hypothetical protein
MRFESVRVRMLYFEAGFHCMDSDRKQKSEKIYRHCSHNQIKGESRAFIFISTCLSYLVSLKSTHFNSECVSSEILNIIAD